MSMPHYKHVEVYSSSPLFDKGDGDIEKNIIIVLADREDGWKIDFIGASRSYYVLYAPLIANSVQDGMLKTDLAFNATSMLNYLYKKIAEPFPLSIQTLHQYNIRSYAWNEIQSIKLGNNSTKQVLLNTDSDVKNLLEESMIIAGDRYNTPYLNFSEFNNLPIHNN